MPELEYVTVDESADLTAEDILKAFEGKPADAIGFFTRDFVRRARLLKFADGNYLWRAGVGNEPHTIAGRPYRICEYPQPARKSDFIQTTQRRKS